MGGYDSILRKHGLTTTASASVSTAAAADRRDDEGGLESLTLGGREVSATGMGSATTTTTYSGDLIKGLEPPALVGLGVETGGGERAVTRTEYRGYNVDPDAMRARMRRNAERRGQREGE